MRQLATVQTIMMIEPLDAIATVPPPYAVGSAPGIDPDIFEKNARPARGDAVEPLSNQLNAPPVVSSVIAMTAPGNVPGAGIDPVK
jgi:hypothetical protein